MELDQSEERVRQIFDSLVDVYGEPDDIDDTDGVRQLLVTILSQNVADENTAMAAEQLFTEFSGYEEIENADLERLKDAINPAGLPTQKAKRIQRSLKALREETGEYSVDFLGEMDDQDAKKWLEEIKGVGPKTASVLLNFHFGADVMPVDTHVERVSKRFRLVPFSASNNKAHDIMNEIVPHELKHHMHVLMIEHGRAHCTARNPTCGETELKQYCSYYDKVIDGSLTHEEFPDKAS
jgi:endonuclease-3